MRTDQENILISYLGLSLETESTGSVDELGFFALIEVGDEDEQSTVYGEGYTDLEDRLLPGWYYYYEGTTGNVWYYGPFKEEVARAMYNEASDVYDGWHEEEDVTL